MLGQRTTAGELREDHRDAAADRPAWATLCQQAQPQSVVRGAGGNPAEHLPAVRAARQPRAVSGHRRGGRTGIGHPPSLPAGPSSRARAADSRAGVGAGTGGSQETGDLLVPTALSVLERGHSVPVGQVEVCSGADEGANRLDVLNPALAEDDRFEQCRSSRAG